MGTFSGNDCSGGPFANCYASTGGTATFASPPTAPGWSPTIYKRNSNDQNQPVGSQDFGNFGSITGAEFAITYDGNTNALSFVYTPGALDPEIHFFTIKQANGFALFGDTGAPITSAAIDLDDYFPGNPGWSHITFFDTGSTVGNGGGGGGNVPEPAPLALIALSLGGLAILRRRAAKKLA